MQRGLLNGGNTAISSPAFAQCWSLDPTSNWQGFKEAATGGAWTLDQSRSANEVNEITGITNAVGSGWATPAHDPAGNMTTLPQPADPTESYTATYDPWNRLVKLTDDDTVQENQYDPRTFRTVRKDYTGGSLSETRHYYYSSGWQGLEERLGSSPNSADAERQFVWGQRYIDDLVMRDRDTNDDGSLDERLYGLQDANWNMTALIDESATVEERYAYSPFGSPAIADDTMATVRTSSDVDIEVLFTGQRFDSNTGLHLFRRRWFDSVTGRFISRDPMGYPDGPNAYAGWFVSIMVDPSGSNRLGNQIKNLYTRRGACGLFLPFNIIMRVDRNKMMVDQDGDLLKPSEDIREAGLLAYLQKTVGCSDIPKDVKIGPFMDFGYNAGTNVFELIPQQSLIPDGDGISGATFWLGTPHQVRVNGEFRISCSCTCIRDGECQIKYKLSNVNLAWEFIDEIDANPTPGDGGLMPWVERCVYVVGDKMLGASFNLSVFMRQTNDMELSAIVKCPNGCQGK